jgi:anthranilate 1,2-dioxygenase small subunit
MNNQEAKVSIEDLIYAYAQCIDDNKLEEWPDFFTDECVYKIISRENYSRNLLATIIYCSSKGMLQDRITAHRHANIYEPHVYNHHVNNIRIVGKEDDTYLIRANYAIYQTKQDGITELFSVGKYEDKVVFIDGQPKFKEKFVVFDTTLIPTLLVTPI